MALLLYFENTQYAIVAVELPELRDDSPASDSVCAVDNNSTWSNSGANGGRRT
jgi:hypothetical protein